MKKSWNDQRDVHHLCAHLRNTEIQQMCVFCVAGCLPTFLHVFIYVKYAYGLILICVCAKLYVLVRCLRIHPVQSVVNNIRQLSGRGFLCICCIKLCLSQLYVFFLCSSMEAELWTHDMLRIVNLNCPECFVVKFRNVKVWVVDKLRKWNCLCFWKCWSVEGETCVVYKTLFMLTLLYVCNYAFWKFKYFEIVYLLSSVFVLFVWYTETLLVCFFTHILKEHYILCLITWAGNGVTEGRDGF